VLIDFTRPEGTLAHLAVCRRLGVGGDRHHRLFARAEGQIAAHAQHLAMVWRPT
jgi:4-hydroxy-tetrahydrodipicolinate reductase